MERDVKRRERQDDKTDDEEDVEEEGHAVVCMEFVVDEEEGEEEGHLAVLNEEVEEEDEMESRVHSGMVLINKAPARMRPMSWWYWRERHTEGLIRLTTTEQTYIHTYMYSHIHTYTSI